MQFDDQEYTRVGDEEEGGQGWQKYFVIVFPMKKLSRSMPVLVFSFFTLAYLA